MKPSSAHVLVEIMAALQQVQFTTEQRVFMVVNYLQTDSPEQTKRLFAVRFPLQKVPSKSTIQRNVTKYLTHGTSKNRNADGSGRPRTARTDLNIQAVREAL